MKAIKTSFAMLGICTLITGLFYPMAITGIGALLFRYQAGGSLIHDATGIVGSELIGQTFTGPGYFHGRPSSSNYDAMNSGGTNLGPTNLRMYKAVRARADMIRKENGLDGSATIPSDLVFASGSGLDPHISLEGALMQAPRVARERKIDATQVTGLIMKNAGTSCFNMFGTPLINVLVLNRALDSAGRR